MTDKVAINYLLGLTQKIDQINLDDADVKTAYWISRNLRLLSPFIKEFEALRNELTNTAVFKAYQKELAEAEEADKAAVQEKYKEVIADADKELADYLQKEVDLPAFVKLSVDEIVGLKGKDVLPLFDLIDGN